MSLKFTLNFCHEFWPWHTVLGARKVTFVIYWKSWSLGHTENVMSSRTKMMDRPVCSLTPPATTCSQLCKGKWSNFFSHREEMIFTGAPLWCTTRCPLRPLHPPFILTGEMHLLLTSWEPCLTGNWQQHIISWKTTSCNIPKHHVPTRHRHGVPLLILFRLYALSNNDTTFVSS